jgi:hypothetical protein
MSLLAVIYGRGESLTTQEILGVHNMMIIPAKSSQVLFAIVDMISHDRT